MTGTNGTKRHGSKPPENRPQRNEKGHFLQGCAPGPGRPTGSFDFRYVVYQKAEEHGVDLEEALWQVFESMVAKAVAGDSQAARFVVDRMCGPVAKPELHFDNRSVNMNGRVGPPIPPPREFALHLKRVAELSAEYLGDDVPSP